MQLPPPSWPPRLYHPSCCPTAFGMSVLLMNRWGCPPPGDRLPRPLLSHRHSDDRSFNQSFPGQEKYILPSRYQCNSCLCRLLFAAPALYLLIAEFLPLAGSVWRNLAGMSVFAAVLVLFCSMEWIRKLYDFVMDGICKILFRQD